MDAFVLCGDREENVLPFMRWHLDAPLPGFEELSNKLGLTFLKPRRVPAIWLRKKPKTPEAIGTLAHEAMHVTRFILVDHIGMELNRDSDEAYAHTLGHIVTTALEELK